MQILQPAVLVNSVVSDPEDCDLLYDFVGLQNKWNSRFACIGDGRGDGKGMGTALRLKMAGCVILWDFFYGKGG